MKKKYILTGCLIVCMSCLITACKDYLNVDKYFRDLQSEDRIFAQKDYTNQWLAFCFETLCGDNLDIGTRRVNISNFCDDMIFNEGKNGLYFSRYKLGEYQYISDDEYNYSHSWAASYDGIRQASILIHNIHKNQEMTEDEKTDIKGQARFARAYLYWLLLRKYGPVPILPDEGADYTLSYEELSFPRNTYDECVELIASEMIQAAKELKADRSPSEIVRPTKGAALAARAKALLFAASPLANGNTEMADFTDKTGHHLISQEYDEGKWARAAAAALDVINLDKYELYVSYETTGTDLAYPATITPPYNSLYSDKSYPDGWADIDPLESYRSIFNGDVMLAENPEMIFSLGKNSKDFAGIGIQAISGLVKNQLPNTIGGTNSHGVTQKQCDAYAMADGSPFDRHIAPKGFTTKENIDEHLYDNLQPGVWMEYANREPRFYASVAPSGTVWPCTSAAQVKSRYVQLWYYRGESDGRLNATENWIPTGIGVMKFVNPADCNYDSGIINHRTVLTIRYADILLMYAEALNELTGSHQIPSWDGSTTYSVSREIDELRKGIKPVRMRAGIPDYDGATYADQDQFRKKIKNERQVEFFAENHRYYDIRRWKDAPKEEGEPIYGCNTLMDKEHAEDFYVPVQIPDLLTAFSRKMYFWPILKDELQRNKNLTQAPGWQDFE